MMLNATLFAMAVWFALLIAFAYKFIWPPLMTAIDARNKKIADGLAEAEKGKAALAEGQKQREQMMAEARAQATEMKALNDKQAQAQIDAAKVQAKAEADRIIAAAQAQIEQEKQKAKEQLREQVAALAVAGAEKILKREIDAKAHADMLNQLKAQL
jgi:F-type H+-transporting ATPase subunit b